MAASNNPLDFLADFRSQLQGSMSDQQKDDAKKQAFGQIYQFQGKPTSYTDSAYKGMPQSKVDTTESKEAQNSRPTYSGDSGKSGSDFVKYYADASNSNKSDERKFLDDFNTRSSQLAKDGRVVDAAAIDVGLERSIQDSYDQATIQQMFNFGDFMHKDYKPPAFKNSAPEDVDSPDFKKLYGDIMDDIG